MLRNYKNDFVLLNNEVTQLKQEMKILVNEISQLIDLGKPILEEFNNIHSKRLSLAHELEGTLSKINNVNLEIKALKKDFNKKAAAHNNSKSMNVRVRLIKEMKPIELKINNLEIVKNNLQKSCDSQTNTLGMLKNEYEAALNRLNTNKNKIIDKGRQRDEVQQLIQTKKQHMQMITDKMDQERNKASTNSLGGGIFKEVKNKDTNEKAIQDTYDLMLETIKTIPDLSCLVAKIPLVCGISAMIKIGDALSSDTIGERKNALETYVKLGELFFGKKLGKITHGTYDLIKERFKFFYKLFKENTEQEETFSNSLRQ